MYLICLIKLYISVGNCAIRKPMSLGYFGDVLMGNNANVRMQRIANVC